MRPPIAVLLAIVVALFGCGGESESRVNEPTATSTPEDVSGARLSKSEYEERYRAIGELNAERVRDLQQALESLTC